MLFAACPYYGVICLIHTNDPDATSSRNVDEVMPMMVVVAALFLGTHHSSHCVSYVTR